MFKKTPPPAAGAVLILTLCAGSASAQGLEVLGSRAAAMAAFVAVADDASAVAWNPSGLVSGPMFNIQVDLGRGSDRTDRALDLDSVGGSVGSTLIAIGTTPVGLSYYRLSSTSFNVVSPAVPGTPDRQLRRVLIRTLVTSHLGATVQQSVGDFLTLGATVKLVRGSVGVSLADVNSWDEAFERVNDVPREGSTRGDLDAGAMFAVGQVRAGLVVRNVTSPEFGDEDEGTVAELERHVRAGIAWANRWPGVSQTIVALDADVTRVPHPAGERRDVAVGLEQWLRGQRIGIRGGVRASTIGEARPVVSAGGSFALRAGMYVDGFVMGGSNDDRAWGVAARLTY